MQHSSLTCTNGMSNVRISYPLCFEPNPNVLLGIGESEWAFKSTFTVSKEDLDSSNVDLVFDGLDTFAAVQLVRCTLESCNV
jgi:hypothetical protein